MARLSLLSLAPLPAPPPATSPSGPRSAALWADDPQAAGPWQDALTAEGLVVRPLGGETHATHDSQPPAAALLHLSHGLPPQLSRLREWRAAWPATPLAVACRALRDLDHVLALEMGADDIFDTMLAAPVVASRLRALWRRCSRSAAEPAPSQELRFGALELSLTARRVLLQGQRIELTEGEFEVLWLLAAHAGQPLSRPDILRCVRGLDDHPTDRSIDSRVYRIRAKLGNTGQQRIRTVRHRGYLFSSLAW